MAIREMPGTIQGKPLDKRGQAGRGGMNCRQNYGLFRIKPAFVIGHDGGMTKQQATADRTRVSVATPIWKPGLYEMVAGAMSTHHSGIA